MELKERVNQLEQKLHRLQTEKKRLQRKVANEERKKRDHALIVVGATVLSIFTEEDKEKVINANSDLEISRWVFDNLKLKTITDDIQ